MSAQPKETPLAESTRHAELQLNASIGDQVMHQLGQPGQLHSVQVRKLWDDHFRVNVLVGADAATIHIADCFFLVTDTHGTIVASSPKIVKRY